MSVRAKSPARRKRRSRKREPQPVSPTELLEIPLFSQIPAQVSARVSAHLKRRWVARGEALFDGAPVGGDAAPVFYLVSGDIAVYQRDRAGGSAIANYLSAGECYIEKLFDGGDCATLRLEASCPVELIEFCYADLTYLFNKDPQFREDFGEMIRAVTRRQVSRFDDEFQKEIASFFVQERLTFARRVKVKRMDLCIECDGCYEACRDRHGTDRLGASEVRYGLTEVPRNCHNCLVPECIDKCKFGHITRHPESNEIVISDNCVGCTQCSKGCSFDAIQMHPVEGLDLAKYFPNRSPDARGKNIAQKCDNCTDYADQACITACPTGALFQIDGASLFESWEQFSVHERPGFDAISSPEDRARRWRKWGAAFTLLNLVVLSYECLSRLLLPKLSIGWALMARSGADAVSLEAFSEKALSAGGTFGHSLGYIGGVAMILTQLYYLGRKLAPRLGSVQLWMELHVQLGFLAFIYGFYHTAFIWREPVAVATFALLSVAIISGVLGRYLLYHLPRNQSGQAAALKEIRGELERLNQEMEARFKDRRKGYTVMIRLDEIQGVLAEESRARIEGEEAGEGEPAAGALARLRQSWRALRELVQSERRARTLLAELEPVVQGEARDGESERLLEMMGEKLRLERALRRSERLFRALKAYRVVHVTVSHLSFIALGLHIFRSLTYAL